VLRPPRGLRRAAPLLIAAGLGGGTALAGAEVMGVLNDSPSVINTVEAVQPSAPVAFAEGRRLSVSDIYERSGPGVVQITTTTVRRVDTDPFFNALGFPQQRRQKALGSGFVIDKAGHIVTNFHVVDDAQTVEVSFSNRDSVKARVVGTDPSTDLAVLEVNVDAGALTPLDLGDSDRLRAGDSVVAIGNPFGLERSVTAGIVSALHRPLTAPNDFTIDDVIQTDAAINSGNSGGPLIDARGGVVGVNSAIATGNTGMRGNIGIGFAVPINTVRDVASQLIERGKVEHAFLGIGVQAVDTEVSRLFELPVKRGLMVVRVFDSSAADKAGLRAGTNEVVVSGETYLLGGDILVAVDGREVASGEDLRDVISAKKPGDKLTIEAYRGTEKRSFEVTLGRQPAQP
jgi:S1-C subfamily serine protease